MSVLASKASKLMLVRCSLALLGAEALLAQVTITTASLPAATVGKFYGVGFAYTGGVSPYSWSATGNVPPGLAVIPGGTIVGTPTSSGSYAFMLTVSDGQNARANKSLTLLVVAASLSISTASALPLGVVGQNYKASLAAIGGTSPYRWSATAGLPGGLTLDSQTGILSGIPISQGLFSLAIQVTDAAQTSSAANFTLTINASPLDITTVPPLFAGVVGVGYTQPFAASGGKPPYSWSISSGNTGGLTMDASTGGLRGTPQSAGTFEFSVQVTDGVGTTASKPFYIVVSQPLLTLAILSTLPSGTVGAPYSQKAPAVATGGTPPYQWSVASSGLIGAGLDFNSETLVISGTPTTVGTFTVSLQVSDSNGQIATKALTIVISPSALAITSTRQLPDGLLNASYSAPLAVAGGAPPYTWSAAGLPEGLRMDPVSGVITGTPLSAGNFPVAITVSDGTLNHISDRFTLAVKLPSTPSIRLSGLPETAHAAEQYPIQIALASNFPATITGQAILTFSPETGPTDRTVQFASGGTIANFSIPAGATAAMSDVPLAVQTGTVSGTITISIRLQAGGLDITPLPGPALAAQIGRASPIINDVRVSRSDGKISLSISGYSTAREVTQVGFTFAAANGQTLQASASSITVPVESLFGAWFQDSANAAYGSQFVLTQPFTIQGDANAVILQIVTLTNRAGSTTYRLP